MKHRLCLPEIAQLDAIEPGTRIPLAKDQAHYLSRVLRLQAGAEVGLFDGAGSEWRALLSELSGKAAVATIQEAAQRDAAPVPLILVASWLKGSAMDTVVQKSVELGATAIWLLDAERSNYRVDGKRRANKLAHLERVARAAAEQCETRWLPALREAGDLPALLSAERPGRTLFLDLGGAPLASTAPEPLTLVIGPEGGWSDAERTLAASASDVELSGLGPITLRAETAPLAVLAAIRQSWGWQR